MDFSPWIDRAQEHPGWALLAFAALSLCLHTLGFFKTVYSAERWALKPERHKALRALAYLGAFPLRLAFSLFSAGVATLVWAVLGFFVWALWRVVQG